MKVHNLLAKALYDNRAESSDELEFRKGDIVTVIEQNVMGSEGWWKCSLNGRQGLAPANRLQLITTLESGLVTNYGKSNPVIPNHQNIYQVPSIQKGAISSVPKEQVASIYKVPSQPTVNPSGLYQVPISTSPAKTCTENSQNNINQHPFNSSKNCYLISRCSLPGPEKEVFDVAASQRRESCFAGQAHNISPCNSKDSAYDVPPSFVNPAQKTVPGYYSTLPNPRKSDWIYDTPVVPEKSEDSPWEQLHYDTMPSKGHLAESQPVLYDIPPVRYGSGILYSSSPSNCSARSVQSPMYDIPPNRPLYDVPPSRDTTVKQNLNYDIPPSPRKLHGSIYDTPKTCPQDRTSGEPKNKTTEQATYDVPSHSSSTGKLLLNDAEHDTSSISSSNSGDSAISTLSASSSESLTSSPSTVVKEVTLDAESAIRTLNELQTKVCTSIADLMIFVSSKWRLRIHLEKTIKDIHRAVDNITESLTQFIEFVQGIRINASHLSDSNLQARLYKQLQIVEDSYRILLETGEALNESQWSLDDLIVNNPESNSDDLDRFALVARTVPDDIKRFSSIIIANGKLIFKASQKQNESRQTPSSTGENEKKIKNSYCTLPASQNSKKNSVKRNSSLCAKKGHSENLSGAAKEEEWGYVHLPKKDDLAKDKAPALPQVKKTVKTIQKKGNYSPELHHKSEWIHQGAELKNNPEQAAGTTKSSTVVSQNDPEPKEYHVAHYKLYLGALQKAINGFCTGISSNQPPETFITQSKLIIMVGQKLIDAICHEAQWKETRNDVLRSSSHLCSLLKNLALATKKAATQYPNPAATQELEAKAKELSQHTQQFRALLDL
ncbi:cas scaffolding protein family member 4 isoform X2 [Protopterus annectens]|uniref:cas scaffolding protein family member 4 isoform X2 n=1 Tax=Protopterus annectens TaxID=7888 RepID=UPI001CFB2F98|nr:cas scaffolding protein family member 4 isoform X2 [Protopterus annectens]